MIFGAWRVERKITALYKIMRIWRRRDMAAWAEVKGVIDELKARWAKVSDDLTAVHAKLDECLKKDALDAAELEVAKADLAKVVGEMNDHLHADGM